MRHVYVDVQEQHLRRNLFQQLCSVTHKHVAPFPSTSTPHKATAATSNNQPRGALPLPFSPCNSSNKDSSFEKDEIAPHLCCHSENVVFQCVASSQAVRQTPSEPAQHGTRHPDHPGHVCQQAWRARVEGRTFLRSRGLAKSCGTTPPPQHGWAPISHHPLSSKLSTPASALLCSLAPSLPPHSLAQGAKPLSFSPTPAFFVLPSPMKTPWSVYCGDNGSYPRLKYCVIVDLSIGASSNL